MKGILIVNMGAPSSLKEMKYFLKKMFEDPAILPLNTLSRKLIACIISNTRYKKSWEKYNLIGGSPMKDSITLFNENLLKKIGDEYTVYNAYSYSSPGIEHSINYLYDKGIKDIKVIPMYPHSSFTTTGSIKDEINKIKDNFKDLQIRVAGNYYKNENFIKLWQNLIKDTISKNDLHEPLLLFSAHSIPEYHVKKGDTYVTEIQETAYLIASSMDMDHRLAFQSKIGRIKWVGPDTISVLKELSAKGNQDIVIIPISFLNENLETLYDLDYQIIPYGKKELHIKNLCRVIIPPSHPLLIQTFVELLEN